MDAETRQRLLELVYDLLPEGEAAELRARIEADAETAASLSRGPRDRAPAGRGRSVAVGGDSGDSVRKGQADRERTANLPAATALPQPLAKRSATAAKSLARAANWAVGLAAAALVLVSVGRIFRT